MIYPRYKIYNTKVFKSLFTKQINNQLLENNFTKLTNLKNIITLNFARTGIFYAIKKIISQEKKEILLSPFTIFDIVNVIICAGGKPRFIDTEPFSPHISKKKIEDSLNSNTAGILLTHYHNVNPETEEIINLCNSKNIRLIEDCAISIGGKYHKSLAHVGSKSDYAIFSFGVFKTISSISGGILYVRDLTKFMEIKKEAHNYNKITKIYLLKRIFDKLKFQLFLKPMFFNLFIFQIIKFSEIFNIKNLSKFLKNDPNPVKKNIIPKNYLSKISDFQKNDIIDQFSKVDKLIRLRRENAILINSKLKKNKNLILPSIDDLCDTFQTFPILIKSLNRENLYKFLLKENFDIAKYYYRNCSAIEIFKDYGGFCKNSDFYANNILCLPCYPGIKREYLINLCNKINSFFKI